MRTDRITVVPDPPDTTQLEGAAFARIAATFKAEAAELPLDSEARALYVRLQCRFAAGARLRPLDAHGGGQL